MVDADRFGRVVVERRRLVVAAMLVATLVLGAGLGRVEQSAAAASIATDLGSETRTAALPVPVQRAVNATGGRRRCSPASAASRSGSSTRRAGSDTSSSRRPSLPRVSL